MSARARSILTQTVVTAFTDPEDIRETTLSWEHHRVAFYLASKKVKFDPTDVGGTIAKIRQKAAKILKEAKKSGNSCVDILSRQEH